MLADLKRSGLTNTDAKNAGYETLTAKETKELTGNHAASYKIPYHDIKGNETKYYRVRYLEEVKGAFGSSKKKPLRYTGPKDEVPRFYYPVSFDWLALKDDVTEPLMITEGEKKSEKACKAKLPCISIPGVWAWRSKKKGIAAIPDFDAIKWKGRKVYLCFDNDLMTNPDVIGALNALAHELTSRGANVHIKYLPKGPGKIGLDDYLLKRSAEAFLKLKEEEFKESAELWTLNERLCFIDSLASVYDFEAKRLYDSKTKLLFAFADRTYLVAKANGEGFKEKNAAEDWLKWKQKRRYTKMVYEPGEEAVVGDNVNLWSGWGCEPKRGNVKPFNDLLNYLFKDADALRKWFVQWLAYPIQNPGGKNLTAVLLISEAQGVGKSFVGYIMGGIYGDNFSVIDHEALTSANNEYCVNKQLVLGEEITGGNSRNHADRLKNMITRESIYVNIKYQPQYHIDDRANWLLTSNHVDALFLEARDRRAVVHDVKAEPQPYDFYKRIDKWRANGGPAHVFYYLLNEVDLSDYDPKKPAPSTKAKEEMIALSKSDVDLAVQVIQENPDAILSGTNIVNDNPFLTTTQLQSFINTYTNGASTLIAVSKALRRGGFVNRSVRTTQGIKRLWCVRDCEKHLRQEPHAWGVEYDKHIPKQKF